MNKFYIFSFLYIFTINKHSVYGSNMPFMENIEEELSNKLATLYIDEPTSTNIFDKTIQTSTSTNPSLKEEFKTIFYKDAPFDKDILTEFVNIEIDGLSSKLAKYTGLTKPTISKLKKPLKYGLLKPSSQKLWSCLACTEPNFRNYLDSIIDINSHKNKFSEFIKTAQELRKKPFEVYQKSAEQGDTECPTSWPSPVIPNDYKLVTLTGPYIVAHPYLGPVEVNSNALRDVYVQCGLSAFHNLESYFRPTTDFGTFYTRTVTGELIVSGSTKGTPFSIRLYGPDPEGRFGWIAGDDYSRECYSRTVLLPIREPRRSYPRKFSGAGDIGHKIACVLTPYPFAPFNSNRDYHNFLLEGKILNRNMNKAIVLDMGFVHVRQIFIYGEKRVSSQHRVTWNKKRNIFSYPAEIPLHDSSIFVCKRANSNAENSLHIYYFSENDVDIKSSKYERIRAYSQKSEQRYKKIVIPKFEVLNASHYFKSIIYQPCSDDYYEEALYLALNIYPILSDIEKVFQIFLKAKMPFRLNFLQGYTKDEVGASVRAIFKKSEDIPLPKKSAIFKNWNKLSLPKKITSEKIEWSDAQENYIPNFKERDVYEEADIKRFYRYLATQRLKEILSLPVIKLKKKLMVAEAFIMGGQYKDTLDILNLVYKQLSSHTEIPEALWIVELAESLPKTTSTTLIKDTISFIEEHLQEASLEDLMTFETSLPTLFQRKMNDVIEISPKTSRTLNNKVIFYSAYSHSDLSTIIQLIKSYSNLQCFSLEDIVISATDFCTVLEQFSIVEENGEIAEDGDIGYAADEKSYFWKYEKPFDRIIGLLIRFSPDLKVLNMKNLCFGSYDKENQRTEITIDYLPNILQTFTNNKFLKLEELYLTGILYKKNMTEIKIFENLKDYFPSLKKVIYNTISSEDSIKLTPEMLIEVGQIFRG